MLSNAKTFSAKEYLTLHVFNHHGNGEKPHKCDMCRKVRLRQFLVSISHYNIFFILKIKSFVQSYALTLHKRSIHSDERPFSCPICSQVRCYYSIFHLNKSNNNYVISRHFSDSNWNLMEGSIC